MRLLKIIGAVAVINILARLFGFAREVVIGIQYGTSITADSIITAFTIPNFIYIVLGGAVTTSFISIYSKINKEKKQDFIRTIFTYLTIIVGILTALFMMFSEWWVKLFFSGLTEEGLVLTSELFLIMAPATFFLVLAMWLSGLLNVHEKYRLTAVATLLFNGAFVAVAVVLTPLFSAYAYGIGASLGGALMFVLLFLTIRKKRLASLRFSLVKMDESRRLFRMALPILFGGATLQFYFFIQRIFAAELPTGVIASLNYASKLTQFPQAVLMTSVTIVIYPMLAKMVANGEQDKLKVIYQKGFRWLALLLFPATIFVYVYAHEIIRVIFEYGSFDQRSTLMTYPLLQILALSMLGMALNMYITRFFYALEKAYLPVFINIASVFGVNVLVIVVLLDELGAAAIAWGTVIGTLFNVVLLIALAWKSHKLVIVSRDYAVKLLLLLTVTGLATFISDVVPITIPLFKLMFGGFVMTLTLIVGLFAFRFKEETQMFSKKMPFKREKS